MKTSKSKSRSKLPVKANAKPKAKKYSLKAKAVIAGVALLICIGIGVAVGLYHIHTTANRSKYTGPLDNVTTGLIGEYAGLILIAKEKGYFADNGLNVTIKDYNSGPESLQALFKGEVDTAMAADFAGVRETLHGKDLRIMATLSKSKAFFMVADKSRGINTVADLKHKRIGITRKTVGEFFLGRFLISHDLGLDDVTIVDLPQADLLKAQQDGRIDAAVLFEPNAYKSRMALGDRAVEWSVQSEDDIHSILYTSPEMTIERPGVLDRYMRAVVEAEVFVKMHDEAARTIIAKRLHYDQAYVDYIWPRFTFEASLEQELLIGLDDQARWVIENHLTTRTEPVNYLRLIYFEGLEHAKPEGISIIR